EWFPEIAGHFKFVLSVVSGKNVKQDDPRFEQTRKRLESQKLGFAIIVPRGIGSTRWSEPGTPDDAHLRRRFALLGQTLDGMRVWDVRRGIAALRALPELKGVPIMLEGKGEMAGIALYAGIFEPAIARLDVWHLSTSHRQAPIIL